MEEGVRGKRREEYGLKLKGKEGKDKPAVYAFAAHNRLKA